MNGWSWLCAGRICTNRIAIAMMMTILVIAMTSSDSIIRAAPLPAFGSSSTGSTPLESAVHAGNHELVSQILALDPLLIHMDIGKRALEAACSRCDPEMIRVMMLAGYGEDMVLQFARKVRDVCGLRQAGNQGTLEAWLARMVKTARQGERDSASSDDTHTDTELPWLEDSMELDLDFSNVAPSSSYDMYMDNTLQNSAASLQERQSVAVESQLLHPHAEQYIPSTATAPPNDLEVSLQTFPGFHAELSLPLTPQPSLYARRNLILNILRLWNHGDPSHDIAPYSILTSDEIMSTPTFAPIYMAHTIIVEEYRRVGMECLLKLYEGTADDGGSVMLARAIRRAREKAVAEDLLCYMDS